MSETTPNEPVQPSESLEQGAPTESQDQGAPAESLEQGAPAAGASSFKPLQRTPQEMRKASNRQLWMGLLWWAIGAGGIAASLTSTSQNVYYWFGGLIAAPFAWYRAFKLYKQSNEAGAPKAGIKQFAPAIVIAALVIASAAIVTPEYIHVNNPGVDTCWNLDKAGNGIPIACFAPDANYKTISLVKDPSECPAESDMYFDPSQGESSYTCLVKLK